MQTTIITDRLKIDMLDAGDYDFILELVNSEGWLRFIGNRNIHTIEQSKTFIKSILNNQFITYRVVRLKKGNVAAGIISFIKRPYLGHFDIGFAFLPAFHRPGLCIRGNQQRTRGRIQQSRTCPYPGHDCTGKRALNPAAAKTRNAFL
jgi:ribosomal-protein-alanine N-acetyltransferase